MESKQFDRLTRTLSTATRRRAILGLLGGLTAAGIGHAQDASAKKKKRKKKKPTTTSPPPSTPSTPPTPVATCSDGVRNGNETDVDCGGSCGRCGFNQACLRREDCDSALCANNVCVTCERNTQCGSDSSGPCGCSFFGTCASNGGVVFAADCDACPAGTVSCAFIAAGVNRCHPRCGATFA